MATRHGKNAALSLDGKALTGFLDSLDLSFDLEQADTTTFGASWRSSLVGFPSGKLEFSGYYDPTASTGPGAILFPLVTAGTAVTGLVYPGGNTSGQILYTITSGCIVTSYSESSTVGGAVTFKGSCDITALPVRTVI